MKKRKCPCRETKSQSWLWSARAFTCLELLVVIGVLSVLAFVMAPALARTRPNSNAAQCLANLRQLATAWTMYVDDSGGVLPPNRDGSNAGKSPFDACWVGGWLDYSTTDNTNVALLVNHQQYPYAAYLGPYVKTASLFKCPSDRSKAYYGGVEMVPRTRTVSMNSRVGTLTRSWAGSDNYRLYTTVSSMAAPKPSDLFVLCDEREDSINEGCFQVDPATPGAIIDFPGAYHECAGSFGFVDGHVELRRWQDPRTVPLLVPGQLLPLNLNFPRDPDVEWIQQHSSARK